MCFSQKKIKMRINTTTKHPTKIAISGKISAIEVEHYLTYLQNLQQLCVTAVPGSTFWGTQVLKLSDRHGFGWAVKTTLEQVETEFVPWVTSILRPEF